LALQTNAAKSAELEAQETAAAAAKATAAAELTFAVALNKAAEPTVAKVAELDDQEVSEKAKEVPKRKYTIQLLALSKFSQDRLDYYCKKHKLDAKMLINMRSEEWVKIFYGKFDSEREAISVRDNLVQNHHLSKLMVVVL
jgi:septal ring-binding cell division protein DamX